LDLKYSSPTVQLQHTMSLIRVGLASLHSSLVYLETYSTSLQNNIAHMNERTWRFSYWSLDHNSLTAQDCMPAMLREMITKYSLLKWYQIKYTYHTNRDKLRHKSAFLQNTSGNSTL